MYTEAQIEVITYIYFLTLSFEVVLAQNTQHLLGLYFQKTDFETRCFLVSVLGTRGLKEGMKKDRAKGVVQLFSRLIEVFS